MLFCRVSLLNTTAVQCVYVHSVVESANLGAQCNHFARCVAEKEEITESLLNFLHVIFAVCMYVPMNICPEGKGKLSNFSEPFFQGWF